MHDIFVDGIVLEMLGLLIRDDLVGCQHQYVGVDSVASPKHSSLLSHGEWATGVF